MNHSGISCKKRASATTKMLNITLFVTQAFPDHHQIVHSNQIKNSSPNGNYLQNSVLGGFSVDNYISASNLDY